jgi:hypothetical protein
MAGSGYYEEPAGGIMLGIFTGTILGLPVGAFIGAIIALAAGLGDKTIKTEGMSDLYVQETLDKLRKKARIPDYK